MGDFSCSFLLLLYHLLLSPFLLIRRKEERKKDKLGCRLYLFPFSSATYVFCFSCSSPSLFSLSDSFILRSLQEKGGRKSEEKEKKKESKEKETVLKNWVPFSSAACASSCFSCAFSSSSFSHTLLHVHFRGEGRKEKETRCDNPLCAFPSATGVLASRALFLLLPSSSFLIRFISRSFRKEERERERERKVKETLGVLFILAAPGFVLYNMCLASHFSPSSSSPFSSLHLSFCLLDSFACVLLLPLLRLLLLLLPFFLSFIFFFPQCACTQRARQPPHTRAAHGAMSWLPPAYLALGCHGRRVHRRVPTPSQEPSLLQWLQLSMFHAPEPSRRQNPAGGGGSQRRHDGPGGRASGHPGRTARHRRDHRT